MENNIENIISEFNYINNENEKRLKKINENENNLFLVYFSALFFAIPFIMSMIIYFIESKFQNPLNFQFFFFLSYILTIGHAINKKSFFALFEVAFLPMFFSKELTKCAFDDNFKEIENKEFEDNINKVLKEYLIYRENIINDFEFISQLDKESYLKIEKKAQEILFEKYEHKVLAI